jgi:L-seryl-tRNA(Ser) seleniumtransferase
MNKEPPIRPIQASVPSVHSLLELPSVLDLITEYGKPLVTDAVRMAQAELRDLLARNGEAALAETNGTSVIARVKDRLTALTQASLRPVLNLTGTVLHTNLGRAPLPDEAIQAVAAVAAGASNLEYDLEAGRRGDRDSHLEAQVCRLTGAEAATVVNNNAAAVLLVLNSLALRKEVLVSRGELIEIGGSFRIPDIMVRAGCKLQEVGTTNRTHLRDFTEALGPRTALILKAHTSNFSIEGFSAAADESDLAAMAKEADVPFVVDLGSGSLIDLAQFGLPHEPTPGETLDRGADLVTFSGDKLLGGPQCGIIAGRGDLLAKIKKNPMKRALRVDKMTIAALSVMLGLYADPVRAVQKIPALRLLARSEREIRALAERLQPLVEAKMEAEATVETVTCKSQVGSGALPVDALPSAGLAIRPRTGKRGGGAALKRLAAAFRGLPLPVIGRIHEGAFVLDLRVLEDEVGFAQQLQFLDIKRADGK